MKYITLFTLLLMLSTSPFASELGQGSICIPKLPKASSADKFEPVMSPPDQYIGAGSTLLIQVDKRKPITVSPSSGAAIKSLSLKGKHRLKIRQGGKVRQSFWFSFEKEGVKDLCLWYYKDYGTFSLLPAKECKCSK